MRAATEVTLCLLRHVPLENVVMLPAEPLEAIIVVCPNLSSNLPRTEGRDGPLDPNDHGRAKTRISGDPLDDRST